MFGGCSLGSVLIDFHFFSYFELFLLWFWCISYVFVKIWRSVWLSLHLRLRGIKLKFLFLPWFAFEIRIRGLLVHFEVLCNCNICLKFHIKIICNSKLTKLSIEVCQQKNRLYFLILHKNRDSIKISFSKRSTTTRSITLVINFGVYNSSFSMFFNYSLARYTLYFWFYLVRKYCKGFLDIYCIFCRCFQKSNS